MRSPAQLDQQKAFEMRQLREKELAMLAVSRQTADARYVQDVVGWVWRNLLKRKAALLPAMPISEQRRFRALSRLEGGVSA